MRAAGNGTAQQCAYNLLTLVQGENPYERCKGIDPRVTDTPITGVMGILAESVYWVLQTFEPRVSPEDTSLLIEDIVKGKVRIGTSLNVGGE